MKDPIIKRIGVTPETSLREVISTIDSGGLEIALVLEESGRLLGTVTDGDVRRGILRGLDLTEAVRKIMNPHPTTAVVGTGREELQRLMRERGIKQIPLVDAGGSVTEVALWSELLTATPELPNAVVILAGGLGTRLRPLTENLPKPLLTVGDKPLLQLILEQLRECGLRQIFLSVNYQAELIRKAVGDGSHLDLTIEYLQEDRPLGTAGSVRMAIDRIREPVLVMNGDLLTQVHYGRFLDYHREGGYDLTVGLKQYEFTVPYGVAEIERDRVTGVREKPVHSVFVNAGIYVLSPEVIRLIPDGTPYNMTDLISRLLAESRPVGGFPIHEYWLDIGEHAQYEKANGDYKRIFEPERMTCS